MHWKRLYLQPLGSDDPKLLEAILTSIGKAFSVSCGRLPPRPLPESAHDANRGQYCSPTILKALSLHLPYDGIRLLGITEVDIYVPQFNYVFGQATVDGDIALISTHRLRPEFYGLPADESLLRERTSKEAIHELGHTFALRHCPAHDCVMHFSTSIEDTDRKSTDFCSECTQKLEMKRKELRAA